MKTKTNHGSTIDLPILNPGLGVSDKVWFIVSRKNFDGSLEFKVQSGKVEQISKPNRARCLVKLKNNKMVWVAMKDISTTERGIF